MGARLFPQPESHRRRRFKTSGLLSKVEEEKKYVNRRGLLPAAGGCGALRVATRGGWWRRSATDRDTTVVGTVAHTRHYFSIFEERKHVQLGKIVAVVDKNQSGKRF